MTEEYGKQNINPKEAKQSKAANTAVNGISIRLSRKEPTTQSFCHLLVNCIGKVSAAI